MFTRHGGTSPGPWDSLNLAFGVGDRDAHVLENRRRLKKALGIKVLVSSGQVHGRNVHLVADLEEDHEIEGYDALITCRPGTGLLIQQADCQAILLHDPVRGAIAAVHCGWRGNVVNILAGCIGRMAQLFNTDPADLRAVISPALGPCCAEFINYRTEFPSVLHKFMIGNDHFDLQGVSKQQLLQAGLAEKHIDVIRSCTMCDRDYFSYRRSRRQGKTTTGRQGSVIVLPLGLPGEKG